MEWIVEYFIYVGILNGGDELQEFVE
ncbi:protein of unknown function [Kyrpidia spormannii]|uniref:Uncharacterized protein n=2 Tax=Kyrpidia spormannii TaxID=2055160 RepID=A0A6F9E495_9BACL|nr:protein of unknown function [Kyrpidia spormannii]CAB3392143.1 protein of unknown function [Kyrpidia spormannii]